MTDSISDRPHLFDLDRDQLLELIATWNLPTFRADQILNWVYQHYVTDPTQMANIAQHDRRTIAERLRFTTGHVLSHQSATDGTQKLLLKWPQVNDSLDAVVDSTTLETECVMIPSGQSTPSDDGQGGVKRRRTVCVSSQVGCPVGCTFCASGLGGLDGNLSSGQIVEQVWHLGGPNPTDRITHVVFMGMGEPLANFDQVIGAIRTLTADWALGISARRITVSTVGLPAQIRRLADLKLSITLAISLHAPNDALRRKLIPWAQYVSIDQLTEAGRYYFDRTGREVTLEYILLGGVNDQPHHAQELVKVAKTLRANVNLIRYNEVDPLPFVRPESTGVLRFQAILRNGSVNTHIRASRGRDIAAACGQLRHEYAVERST